MPAPGWLFFRLTPPNLAIGEEDAKMRSTGQTVANQPQYQPRTGSTASPDPAVKGQRLGVSSEKPRGLCVCYSYIILYPCNK